jgi:type VI protein secretion system component VasK
MSLFVRPHLNQENKKILMEQLNIDASYKAPKKLSQHHGKQVYKTLQTATNEIGQICVQALTGSDALEQLDPALTAMSKTMQEHGQKGPSIAFTNNPSHDKEFLMQKFESLRKKQAELDAFASKLNAADSDSDSSALDATVDARLPRAGSSAFQATQQGVDNAINSQSFQVVES